MSNIENNKKYDLSERTLKFAKKVREYVNSLPYSISNKEFSLQLIRSAGSVGANYIEAEEAFSNKDFLFRIKISKKESKESTYWLNLSEPKKEFEKEKAFLIKESIELTKIFGAIVSKARK
ncbi:MAG: four helix bundle protein [Candidatus Zapsychrus exili]|nr:four helix bundle protein [Candidatus Zapsychrus exili]